MTAEDPDRTSIPSGLSIESSSVESLHGGDTSRRDHQRHRRASPSQPPAIRRRTTRRWTRGTCRRSWARGTPGCACAPSPQASRGIQPAAGRASRSSSPPEVIRRARLVARASRVRRSPRRRRRRKTRGCGRGCVRAVRTVLARDLSRAARASAARAEGVRGGVDLRVPLLPREAER